MTAKSTVALELDDIQAGALEPPAGSLRGYIPDPAY